jgi:hypothetical protein
MRHALWLIALLLTAPVAHGQAYVRTAPNPTNITTNGSSTIGTGGSTFQLLFAATLNRGGCTIQNNGTHNMYVTFNLGVAGSTLTNSIILSAGDVAYCQVNGNVITGEVDITGTAGDAFYAAQY